MSVMFGCSLLVASAGCQLPRLCCLAATVRATSNQQQATSLQRLDQIRDVQIEQLKVVVGAALRAADGGIEDEDVRASLGRNELRILLIEVRLHGDDLHGLRLHQIDQL